MMKPLYCRAVILSLVAFAVNVFFGIPAHAESDLARAYRVIASKKYIDLTHSFGPETPVWSGFGQAKMTAAASWGPTAL